MLHRATLFSTAAMTSRKEPRGYQEDCLQALFQFFIDNEKGEPLAVIPVGGGKSLLMAEFMRRANERYGRTRFMVLSHVSILLSQNAEELLNQWPQAQISFYSDSLGSKDMSGDIIFAGIQSIYKKAYDLRHTVDLLLIDEAQTLSPDDSTMYRKFLDDMRTINPAIRIVGFTGTPFRPGYGYLHKGKNALFTHIAYEISIADLIGQGYLCPMITPEGGVRTRMSVEGVKKRGDDYVLSQLSKAVDKEEITKGCVDELLFHGTDRKKWLVFCVDIKHAEHVTAEIAARGIPCALMHSKMSGMENNAALDRFKNGNLRCLVNVAMLTVGVNIPAIDLISNMRPMRSPVLYIQVGGRGLRLAKDKQNCLFLDHGDVINNLGPIDQVRIYEKGEGEGDMPTKQCENCLAFVPAGCRNCPECNAPFPEPGLNLSAVASDAAVLSSQMKPKIMQVSRASYYRHQKEGKPDSMRVDYLCGFETYREWVAFESFSHMARDKACSWWRQRAVTTPPVNVASALQRTGELKTPSRIHVRKVGKYFEITGVEFGDAEPV